MAAAAAVGALALTGCAGPGEEEAAQPTQTPTASEKAEDPTYPVGTKVILTADHMPGMKRAEATISGAFDTTAYSVSYTPTNSGGAVTDHKWVVHEGLKNPGNAALEEGTKVVLQAEHMPA